MEQKVTNLRIFFEREGIRMRKVSRKHFLNGLMMLNIIQKTTVQMTGGRISYSGVEFWDFGLFSENCA